MQHTTHREPRPNTSPQAQLPWRPRHAAVALVGVAVGCGTGTKTPEVVESPAAGTYVGTLSVERRTYAGGIRVDRKSCGATVVAIVDPEGSPWLAFDADECELGGWADAVVVELAPLDGLAPTGTPMGRMGGDLPDGTWEGVFLDDGSLTITGETSSETLGVRTEWSISVEASDLEGILDDDTGV